ncbi:HAD family hydrolase [Robertmurraya andreesenii]|uniref:Cof subfamily protein (Haloacid dehalogenase superfamily) n=1 Tax=Anoxybacillus andreesenii TaxID=1325932 RepID=A0ABT9V896_9BACL|nr:HAD family hydrolase [Robertmurraya andreesenii]MDQ0157177.1 Cof subfamily protein (haloacid dehalogenase superfamily) [Robertmurraya andreesenii]
MLKVKAIVLDLDGTLLNRDGTISKYIKECLFNMMEDGVKVFLATGRPVSTTVSIHQELELDTPLTCLNGALVYDRLTNRVLDYSPISSSLVSTVKSVVINSAIAMVCQTYRANYQIINLIGKEIERNWPVEEPKVFPIEDEPVLKIKIHFKDCETAQCIYHQLGPVLKVSNWGSWFEVTARCVSKWKSIQKQLKYFNIAKSEVVAFGDGMNDIELLKNAGVGVAMANALPIVKKNANCITLSNEDDGIVFFLNKFCKNIT